MSDFCFVEDACQAKLTIGDGARAVVRVCRIVKLGSRETMRMEPLRYLHYRSEPCHLVKVAFTDPIAYVWQSDAGARAVIGSNIVLALSCSVLEGLKTMTLPCVFPATRT